MLDQLLQEWDALTADLVWQPHPANRPQVQAYLSDAFETLYGGAAGGGKACYTGTMLPTPTGWTTMEDVQPGDFLLTDEGLPCKVVAISETFYDHVCYEVEFDDGEVIIADAEHRWLTFNTSEREALRRLSDDFRVQRKAVRVRTGTGKRPDLALRNSQREVTLKAPPIGSVRTTQDIFETLRVRDGRVNHSVPLSEPLDLPEADLLVPPYTLGAWLGDGKTEQDTTGWLRSD
jgi:replicative DNA helicase